MEAKWKSISSGKETMLLRAFEELNMLAHTEIERERYESRRKAQMDYTSGLNAAREEGREDGRNEQRRAGMIQVIQLCERTLSLPDSLPEQLSSMPMDLLARRAAELQTSMLQRK